VPRIHVLSVFAAVVLGAVPARAQETRPGPAAEAVARAAFRAMEERRWGDVAPLMHPESLRRFREFQVMEARSNERLANDPPDWRDPDMPEAVARWFAEQRNKHPFDARSELRRKFGVDSLAQLEALPAAELFSRWLRAKDPREFVRAQLQAAGKLPRADTVLPDLLSERRVVVGPVVENDSTVLVVYRFSVVADSAPAISERTGVLTVRRSPQGWRLWSGERDADFLGENDFVFSVGLTEDVEKRLREASDAVVSWRAGAVQAGRAFVTGYPGGTRPPKALVVEVAGANGAPARVEIPASVFEEVMEKLLAPWTGLEEEPAQAPARP
jgi:hypothetical protein